MNLKSLIFGLWMSATDYKLVVYTGNYKMI